MLAKLNTKLHYYIQKMFVKIYYKSKIVIHSMLQREMWHGFFKINQRNNPDLSREFFIF